MEEEFAAPYEPENVGGEGCVERFCVSPTNGRLEWMQAKVRKRHLGKGGGIEKEIEEFMLKGDKNQGDRVRLVIHESLGGKGDDVFNVFLQGRSFDEETFDNEVESMVFYALKDKNENDDAFALITVRFIFKNSMVTRPYKLAYQVELPGGDVIENELVNV